MLLNEFLKEHRKVQDLEATAAQQQKGIKVLTASVKEQAAQIQKVSAQIEAKQICAASGRQQSIRAAAGVVARVLTAQLRLETAFYTNPQSAVTLHRVGGFIFSLRPPLFTRGVIPSARST